MRGLRTTLDDMFTDMAFATTEAGQRHRTLLADAENFRLARLARRSAAGRRSARAAGRPDPGPTSSRPVATGGSPASGTRPRTSDRRRPSIAQIDTTN